MKRAIVSAAVAAFAAGWAARSEIQARHRARQARRSPAAQARLREGVARYVREERR